MEEIKLHLQLAKVYIIPKPYKKLICTSHSLYIMLHYKLLWVFTSHFNEVCCPFFLKFFYGVIVKKTEIGR